MKISKTIILLSFIFLFGCDTEEEVNNNSTICDGNIPEISVGSLLQDKTLSNLDSNKYCFQALSDNAYSVILNVKSGNIYLDVFNSSDFSEDAFMGDSGPGTGEYKVSFTSTINNIYYIELYGINSSEYDLNVQNNPEALCTYFGTSLGCTNDIPYSCTNSLYCSASPNCANLNDC